MIVTRKELREIYWIEIDEGDFWRSYEKFVESDCRDKLRGEAFASIDDQTTDEEVYTYFASLPSVETGEKADTLNYIVINYFGFDGIEDKGHHIDNRHVIKLKAYNTRYIENY